MPRFTFTDRFDWRPNPRFWQTFLPGEPRTVKREVADAAAAAGKGWEVKEPHFREERPDPAKRRKPR